jgi:hypothetical protein
VRYDTEFSRAFVLPDIERNLCDGKRKNIFRGAYLRLDNKPADKIKWSRLEIARTKATRVVHPVYPLDVALSDFFLFGDLKDEIVGFTTNSPAYILSEIRRTFQEILKQAFVAAHDEWIIRLGGETEPKWEYYHME